MNTFSSEEKQFSQDSPYPEHLLPMIRVGFGKRLGAWILDNMMITVLVAIVFFAVGEKNLHFVAALDRDTTEANMSVANGDDDDTSYEGQLSETLGLSSTTINILTGLNSIAILLYSLLEGVTGASPGKRLLGIAIAYSDGRKGDFMLFSTRWALKNGAYALTVIPITGLAVVGSMWSFLFLVGCFGALSSTKQALHDMIVRSAIFHRNDILTEAGEMRV